MSRSLTPEADEFCKSHCCCDHCIIDRECAAVFHESIAGTLKTPGNLNKWRNWLNQKVRDLKRDDSDLY